MMQFRIYKTRPDVPSLFWRPPLQLRSLPVETRWEVTRRHPSYSTYWKKTAAADLFDDEEQIEECQKFMDESRVLALNAIGVVPEEAVDPALEFKELGQLNPAWLSGAVHPTSMRGLASLLVSLLPKETLTSLGCSFIRASVEDEFGSEQGEMPLSNKLLAINEIASMDKEGLDLLTPEPFVSINPWASGRTVGEEVKTLLKQWKTELGLDEIRVRSENHQIYLDVWDRREGWNGGRYETGSGKLFIEISEELKRPLTTIHSQYKKAFELITGHQYRFDSFIELFGLIRFSNLFSDGGDLRYRRFNEATNRPVNETKLGISLDTASGGQYDEAGILTYTPADFLAEYQAFSVKGLSDVEAAKELRVEDIDAFKQLIELYKMG